jgi:hypothetical protein
MKLKLSLSKRMQEYWINNDSYFSIKNINKFMDYFFPFIENIENDNNSNDIVVYDTQEVDILETGKINILLCIENCNFWIHYNHYNKYGNYGDKNVKIYLYNHIDKCVITDLYIAIPIIYLQTLYFQKFYNNIKPQNSISFNNKKFCLIATSPININKINIINFLKTLQLGECKNIKEYQELVNESCYHSQKLMDIFNEYKFVFVSENSINDGYITEKIFNCLFSRTIPIYFGSNKIEYFINKNSFINMNDFNFNEKAKLITAINNDENLYNSYINEKHINDYDNENFIQQAKDFIAKNL